MRAYLQREIEKEKKIAVFSDKKGAALVQDQDFRVINFKFSVSDW